MHHPRDHPIIMWSDHGYGMGSMSWMCQAMAMALKEISCKNSL